MLSVEEKRRIKVLANFTAYSEAKRAEAVANVQLPDDSGIRAMTLNAPTNPNIRGRPITDPSARVHTKSPVLRQHPKFVQYSGRNTAATELTRRRGKRAVLLGETSQVTNPLYLKLMDKTTAFSERPRIRPYYGGEHSTKATQNLPPSNLETMMSGKKIYNLGNGRKFQRAASSRQYINSGRGHRLAFGGRLRDGVGKVVRKQDLVKTQRGVRGYNNPFERTRDLAPSVGFANNKSYARNVSRPLNIVTKKRTRNNVGTRPALDNSNYTKKQAPRPTAIRKESSKIIIKDRRSYGKLIGSATVGGLETRPDNFRPLLKELVVRGRAIATGTNLNVVENLYRTLPVKDGNLIRQIFESRKNISNADGNIFVAQPAARGALTVRKNDPTTGGYSMIQGLHHRQNPIY